MARAIVVDDEELTMEHDFAVYAEHSDSNKEMVARPGKTGGWNARVFNRTEVHPATEHIRLDPGTGDVVLKRGVYRITAVSIVTYFDGEKPGGGVPSRDPAYGGYCRLRDRTRPGCGTSEECLNEDAVGIGTMTSANMLPSTIDTYLSVDGPEARLVLEHQVGADVKGILLQLFVVDSTWHVMARISIHRLGDVVENPVKPLDARISKELLPFPKPSARAINRVFNAALGELLGRESGRQYEQIYKRYVGTAPRFSPRSSDCDSWVDAADGELSALLARGEIRFGYVASAPYFYGKDDELSGLDFDLGTAVTEIISQHYFGDGRRLRARWTPLSPPPGDEQVGKLQVLCESLAKGEVDLALTGQMMLPPNYLPAGYDIEWTAPTALLFTAITYNGRDRQALNLRQLRGLRSGSLDDFMRYALAESQRLSLELRFFAVVNPGPSPDAAMSIVSQINGSKGRAVWDVGDVARSGEVMSTGADHFSVGDSLATGAGTLDPGFRGLYLNIPANIETVTGPDGKPEPYVGLWPIAGFTAKHR